MIHNTNGVVNFNIPNDMDLTSERLIALVSYIVVSANKADRSTNYTLDYHYYLRNGNGICPNGHGDKYSMWSHNLVERKLEILIMILVILIMC